MRSFVGCRPFAVLLTTLTLGACGAPASSRASGEGESASGDGGADARDASSPGGPAPTPLQRALFSPAVTRVVVEVDYVPGAEPYTGNVVGFGETWNLFATNAKRLFASANKTFVIPKALSEMQALDDVQGSEFTTEAILAIAKAHRDDLPTADTATFYAVWLNGYYRDGEKRRDDVLGVSVGDSGVIAMFKPVISSAGGLAVSSSRYIEQTTLIHEFGHSSGLVANGIPASTPHEDTAHGKHCTNTSCIMYWANDGSQAADAFVRQAVLNQDSVIYGQECLDDAAAAIAAAAR